VGDILDSEEIGTQGSKRMHESLKKFPNIRLYELSGPLFFGVASELESSIQHGPGEILILRMKHVNHMDASALNILNLIINRALKNGGKVYLSTLQPKIKAKLEKLDIIKKLGGTHYCPDSTTKAIELAKKDLMVGKHK
jgi:SulP family sulfate permease